MKKNRIIYIVLLLLIFSTGCRKKVVATDIDSSEYGWLLYEQGKYIESNSWFINAVIQDSMFSDGYNGLGWSYGQIGEIDSSISSFSKGIIKLVLIARGLLNNLNYKIHLMSLKKNFLLD